MSEVRSLALLLGGMALVAVGVGLIVGEVPGRWVAGPALVLAGLAVKTVGLLVGGGPEGPGAGDGRVTTLGGSRVDRPRAGIPAGRAQLRTGHRAAPAGARAVRPDPAAQPRRRAS